MVFGHSKTGEFMRGVESWWVLIKCDINTFAKWDLWKEFGYLKSRGAGINELWRKEIYLRCLWIGRGGSSCSVFKILKLLCRSFFLSKASLKAPAVLSTCQGCNDGNFVSIALHNRAHYVMVNFSVCSWCGRNKIFLRFLLQSLSMNTLGKVVFSFISRKS